MSGDSPKIIALKQRYTASLSEKSNQLREIYCSLQEAEKPAPDVAAMQAAVDYLHKLAGSAGMYGYADVAKLAREAISSCRNEDIVELNQLLVSLIDACQRHSGEA